jgi:hypothetical protein
MNATSALLLCRVRAGFYSRRRINREISRYGTHIAAAGSAVGICYRFLTPRTRVSAWVESRSWATG